MMAVLHPYHGWVEAHKQLVDMNLLKRSRRFGLILHNGHCKSNLAVIHIEIEDVKDLW